MAQRSRDVIRGVIAGKPDEEVMRLTENMGGVDAVIDMIFQGIEDALVVDRAEDAVIGWRISDGTTTHPIELTIKGDKASYAPREARNPRVTLALAFTDLMRLISGEFDGTKLLMAGKLEIGGDTDFAQKIPRMFGIA